MLAPLSWLKKYVAIDMPAEEFARRMIMNGNAVEEVEDLSAEVTNVVVGRILSVVPHGNSDHLHICKVDVGAQEPIQIVTGADNMAAGDFVPVALHDSHLPGGVHIKRGKLRGEVSEGMMCSGEELGVPADVYPSNTEHGLLILRGEDLVPGQDIRPVLGLDDAVLNFEILANRPDCLSMLGLAHEAAVVTGGKVAEPALDYRAKGEGKAEDLVDIAVEAPDLCRRYCAAAIRNIRIAPSPLWMRQALHKAGVRPINNVVDITNFVMLEMGQPMHAFDLDKVAGRKIRVRRARPGETLQTLDGKERQLTENMLVIADEERATGLAGIMGGEESEITEDTKLVLFESACFDSACTRQAGRALGLRTEAQGRFERGVNERLCKAALQRALHLMEILGAGEVVPGVIDIYPEEKPLPEVRAKADYLYTLMGVEVPMEEMKRILLSLGIKTRIEGDELVCLSPAWRQDIVRGADIAEEVLRVYGYDHIPSTKMRKTEAGANSAHQMRDALLRRLLCGMGAYEAATFSFIGPKWLDALRLPADSPYRCAAKLQNPLGEENSLMRTTLVPSMLSVLATNANRGNAGAAFFEIGKRFLPKSLPLLELPEERPSLCVGLYGEEADFYAIKGMAEAIFTAFGVQDVRWTRAGDLAPWLHPGRGAAACAGDTLLGTLGEVHPDTMAAMDGKVRAYVAEIDLAALEEMQHFVSGVKDMPRYPAVQRDFAFVLAEDVPVGEVMRCVRAAAGALCEGVQLFDVYRGAPIAEGEKSVAIALTLRAADHTLTEEEIVRASDAVVEAAAANFAARLRS